MIFLVLATARYEDFKNAHEHSTVRMRLGLRVSVSLLIGNNTSLRFALHPPTAPYSILILAISLHAYVRVLRITH